MDIEGKTDEEIFEQWARENSTYREWIEKMTPAERAEQVVAIRGAYEKYKGKVQENPRKIPDPLRPDASISLEEYWSRLYQIATGGLGWTDQAAMETPIPRILLAIRGAVEFERIKVPYKLAQVAPVSSSEEAPSETSDEFFLRRCASERIDAWGPISPAHRRIVRELDAIYPGISDAALGRMCPAKPQLLKVVVSWEASRSRGQRLRGKK